MALKMATRKTLTKLAQDRAEKVMDMMAKLGVEAKLVGSLATGRFAPGSDVDFLILTCPQKLKYTLEAKVENLMGDIGFDVVYADETPAHVLRKMTTLPSSAAKNA
jgi:predicted nucleotidyltransferase